MRPFYVVFGIAVGFGIASASCGSTDSVAPGPVDSGSSAGDADASASSDGSLIDRMAVADVATEAADGPGARDTAEGDVGSMSDAADADAGPVPGEGGDAIPDLVPCAGGTVDCDHDGTCEDLQNNPAHCGRCDHGCLGGACLARQCQPFAIATGMRSPMGVVAVGTDVYATDFGNPPAMDGRLVRIAANGTIQTLETGLNSPTSLAYNQSTDSLLMSSYFTPFAVLSRPRQADAGAVTTLISNQLSFPLGIASNTDWVFIVNYGDLSNDGQQTIQRRPRGDLTSYTYFSDFPNGQTHLDIDARYLYWAEMNNGRVLRRPVGADPDAGIDVEVIASGQAPARGIAVDGAVIYFTRYSVPVIDGGPGFGLLMRVDNVPGSTPAQPSRSPGPWKTSPSTLSPSTWPAEKAERFGSWPDRCTASSCSLR